MFEAELNSFETSSDLPEEVIKQFSEWQDKIISRSILPWGEHCTECMFPFCYQTCSLYTPRIDGSCRLFVNGMTPLAIPSSCTPYILKIDFKKWGRLFAFGNTRMFNYALSQKIEKRDLFFSKMLQNLPLPKNMRMFFTNRYSSLKNHYSRWNRRFDVRPDFFLLECYNPGQEPVDLTLTIRPDFKKGTKAPKLAFEHLIVVKPGFIREMIPVSDIEKRFPLNIPFKIDITPNNGDKVVRLYFGSIDFVKTSITAVKQSDKKVKCVVWDLDNTLWKGVLIEDGIQKLQLKSELVKVIKELDNRGILNSVASKNNYDDAVNALKSFGLLEYFIFPQISWKPKSQAIKAIAKSMNISLDTFLFVDDQLFEREEVAAVCPEVRVVDAADALKLPLLEACNVPVTEESKNRRLMYKQSEERQKVQDSFTGDYFEFLRTCNIELIINKLMEQNLDRVYELAQRTNQMNFSGNRYEKSRLEQIINDGNLDTYVIECRDRFGTYGIVGFCIVEKQTPKLIDLMFSCRIQSKRVEHAVLNYLLSSYFKTNKKDFFVHYFKTDKNANSAQVFTDLGFETHDTNGNVFTLKYPVDKPVNDEKIISIQDLRSA